MNNGSYLKLITALIFVIFTGCGGHQAIHRQYEGDELPKSDVSIIKGHTPLVLLKIDGIAGPNKRDIGPDTRYQYNSWFDGSFSVELMPGEHNFLIYYKLSTMFSRVAYNPESMKVSLEAGKTYTIEAWRNRKQWNARVIEIATGKEVKRLFR